MMFPLSLVLFALADSELSKAGEAIGLVTAHEVFADRTYQSNGMLTSRSQDDAMITDQEQSAEQVIMMVKEGKYVLNKGRMSLYAQTRSVFMEMESMQWSSQNTLQTV